MKRIAAALALTLIIPLARAEDLAPALRGCRSYSSAADFVASTASSKKPHIVNGISYFKPRAGVVYNGMDILAVFAYGYGLKGAPDDPAYGYGVVIEGTVGYASTLIKGTPQYVTTSSVSIPGHEFVEIGCSK